MGVVLSAWGLGGFHAPAETEEGVDTDEADMIEPRFEGTDIPEETDATDIAGTGAGAGTMAGDKAATAEDTADEMDGAFLALSMLIIRLCSSACLSSEGDSEKTKQIF